MNTEKSRIIEYTESLLPEIIDIRHHLHENPELSEHESETQAFICRCLDEMGIEYRGTKSGYGVIATIYGKDRTKAVGIRADIDALPVTENVDIPFASKVPGVMHACGHDIHTAVLLGTARVLKSMESTLPASVKLFFQPSEETIGGAAQMIAEGYMENPAVTIVISLHVDPSVETGKVLLTTGAMNAAALEFRVKVKGKSCHGAHPDTGIDPLIPACAMVSGIQSIITRRMDPADPCLITVGSFHSGKKSNVIPDETVFEGIIRALSDDNLSKLTDELTSLCSAIAIAHGAECEVTTSDRYPVLVNDDHLLEVLRHSASEFLGASNVLVASKPSLGADDFAFFCEKCPCFYYSLGVTPPGAEAHPLHSDKFCPDEESIKYGVLTEVAAVLELLKEI